MKITKEDITKYFCPHCHSDMIEMDDRDFVCEKCGEVINETDLLLIVE